MINYQTDEERAEAIKKWWKENGISVVAGVVVGLGAIFGWRAWNDHRDSVGQQASAAFEQLLASAETGDAPSALAQSKLLAEEYSSTTYAALAALVEARVEIEEGNLVGARAALERVVSDSPDPGLTGIAVLRLARVLIASGDLEAAAAVVEKHEDVAGFAGAFAAIRGDVAKAQGRTSEARSAWQDALAAGAPDPERLRLKLDDLPPAG